MTRAAKAPIRRDWIAKTSAGAMLGLSLGLGLSALYSDLHPALALAVRGQLAMWMVAPVWLITLSSVFFFSSGARAWCWLGGVNLLTYGALLLLRLS